MIKKESDGDIRVRIYYYGQLGTENDIVELAAKGTIQFVSVGAGHLGSYVPEVQAVSLPYVLGTNEAITHKVLTESPTIYNKLAPKFESVNLKLLSMMSEGEMVWGGNKPIRTPEDFANQKIRTFTSTIPVETYKALVQHLPLFLGVKCTVHCNLRPSIAWLTLSTSSTTRSGMRFKII